MDAKCFQTAEAMSDYQVARELQEALRVQSMSPAARLLWLKDTWGRLQDGASFLFADVQHKAGAARCYASLEEKNRFDDDREIKLALQMHITG